MNLLETIKKIKKEWAKPRLSGLRLVCFFEKQGVSRDEILTLLTDICESQDKYNKLIIDIPEDLKQFWLFSESAHLFKDVDYGQWGIKILNPNGVKEETDLYRKERTNDFRLGDMIIGKFSGDLDLLLIRCAKRKDDFGKIIVVRPMDPRHDWYIVAKNFHEFLEVYSYNEGDKYWELSQ